MAGIAHFLDEALRDALQDSIALGMAERVIDRLEAVEIEEQDRAGDIGRLRGRQRLAEQLADAAAIGEAREHVHVGEIGEALLRLPHLGDVGADAAKALELAGHGDDRVAGAADPRSEEHTSELQSLMRISYADLGV